MGLNALLRDWFPGWAAAREMSRARLVAAERLFEVAKDSGYRPRRGDGSSADAVLEHGKHRLVNAARYYDENHPHAIAVLDEVVNQGIGGGLKVEPMVMTTAGELDEHVNEQIRDGWAAFWALPEVTGELPGVEVERLAYRSWARDGENFTVLHSSQAAPFPTAVPLVLELLESDFCPMDLFTERDNVVHGIQKNQWNRPIAYTFYKRHPGSHAFGDLASFTETKTVPAERVLHLKFMRRFGQTRGQSLLHGVMNALDDIKEIEESERIAARIAAAFCAVITKGDMTTANKNVSGDRQFKMRPGAIFNNLGPGEGVEVIDSKRPNSALPEFIRHTLRNIAAGSGTRYSPIARDYNGTYSSQRQELVEAVTPAERMRSYFVSVWYRPIREHYITAAILNGNIKLSPNTDRATLAQALIMGPSIPWIQPKQEMDAFATAADNEFMSVDHIRRSLGQDPRQVAAEIARQPKRTAPAAPAAAADDEPIADDDEEAA